MASSSLVYTGELDSRESSETYSSQSSIYRNHGLFSFSDSGNLSDFNRRLPSSDNELLRRAQDNASMFSASSTVRLLMLLGLSSTSSKASGSPAFWWFPFYSSARPWPRNANQQSTRGKCNVASRKSDCDQRGTDLEVSALFCSIYARFAHSAQFISHIWCIQVRIRQDFWRSKPEG